MDKTARSPRACAWVITRGEAGENIVVVVVARVGTRGK